MTVYYDTRDLNLDGVEVLIASPEGDVVAKRKTIKRGERTHVVWRLKHAERIPGQRIRYHYIDLPKHVQITRWRPDPEGRSWPHPLPPPAPMERDVAWQTKAGPVVPPEPEDPFDWLAPTYTEPGKRVPEREIEIRVARGLRTERSRFAVKDDSKTTTRDSVVILMLRQLGKMEYEHQDPNELLPAGMAWEPTRLDHADWIIALGWYVKLPRRMREVVFFRSLNPPFSYRAIGEMQRPHRSHTWARFWYKRALKQLTRIANQHMSC